MRRKPSAFGNLHAYRDEIVPWLRELADACHEHGAAVMMQITHLGRRTNWNHADWLPVLAPSLVREGAHRAFPKIAEDWDIERIVGQYADAAERMRAGGLDGIELEAYGHLMDQFWSPATNHRVDEYGTIPLDDLYVALRPASTNLGEVDHAALIAGEPQSAMRNPGGRFQLFRIGDAVASRNFHAAIYDALRLCKDL